MWFIPSNPQDIFQTQLEQQNFFEEQNQKKNFYNDIKRIADAANKKSTFAAITSVVALLIALGTMIIELLEFLY